MEIFHLPYSRLLPFAMALLGAVPLAHSGTIAAVLPADGYQSRPDFGGLGVYSVGWSQTGSYTNVTIRMALKDFGEIPEAGSVRPF